MYSTLLYAVVRQSLLVMWLMLLACVQQYSRADILNSAVLPASCFCLWAFSIFTPVVCLLVKPTHGLESRLGPLNQEGLFILEPRLARTMVWYTWTVSVCNHGIHNPLHFFAVCRMCCNTPWILWFYSFLSNLALPLERCGIFLISFFNLCFLNIHIQLLMPLDWNAFSTAKHFENIRVHFWCCSANRFKLEYV